VASGVQTVVVVVEGRGEDGGREGGGVDGGGGE
jgi:hypothetical protein